MAVSLLVASFLKKQGYHVHLTREADVTCSLDQRTTSANMAKDGQLFVSIHANSSHNFAASGLETFYLGHEKFHESFSELFPDFITAMGKYRMQMVEESKKLATVVHKAVLSSASTHQPVIDRSVKQAAMQVFCGSKCLRC